ncbi:MAG: substrate-binding domain-containing protein [Kiritimatiellae bacterium]|nr:substrate-binding domain-containing protein [Kiritimatiellia bacterium]
MPSSLYNLSRPGEVYLAASDLARSLKPGDRMPPYKELRRRWKVPQRSIDIAYDRLQAQGVLTRRWGRGIFVEAPLAGGTFAFIASSSSMRGEEGAYNRSWFIALEALLQERHPEVTLEMVVTPDDRSPAAVNNGRDAALRMRLPILRQQTRLLGAFGSYAVRRESLAFCRELNIPYVSMCPLPGAPSVKTASLEETCAMGLEHLLNEGWRDIGVIGGQDRSSLPAAIKRLPRHLQARAARVRNYGDSGTFDYGDWRRFEKCWMDLAGQLLADRHPPEALILLDDVICRSMLLGAQLAGVNLPERFAMVTASNEDLPIYASRELTRMENSGRAIAAEGLRIMMALLDGKERVAPRPVMPTLIMGASSRKPGKTRNG